MGLLLLVSVLAGCSGPAPAPTATVTLPGELVLYSSPTPIPQAARAGKTPAPTFTNTPLPTPTPFTHVIVKGDTMGSIAFKYGVSVQDLLAANPDVNPHFMTVGKTVVVPVKVDGGTPAVQPTLTPAPVQYGQPACYPDTSGGMWCFVMAHNDARTALENLSARITLVSPEGESLGSQVAFAPLNLLPAGQSIALAASFAGPVPAGSTAYAEALTALPVPEDDRRYLPASAEVRQLEINPDGLQATAIGSVMRPSGSKPAGLVWLAAVAFGEDGQVVGLRKWEAGEACQGYRKPKGTATPTQPAKTPKKGAATATAPPPAQSTPVECLPFEVTVYSLGPAIRRVEVLVEARP